MYLLPNESTEIELNSSGTAWKSWRAKVVQNDIMLVVSIDSKNKFPYHRVVPEVRTKDDRELPESTVIHLDPYVRTQLSLLFNFGRIEAIKKGGIPEDLLPSFFIIAKEAKGRKE